MSEAIGIDAVHVEAREAPLRSIAVRLTHWTAVFGVGGLIYSGVGILISHPRLYWGETGAVGAPSLIDLPLPFIIGPSVWNRPIHFFFAWILVFAGLAYYLNGFISGHFRKDLLPDRKDLDRQRLAAAIAKHARGDGEWRYNAVQRLTYLAVVFGIFPGILWTGLAMSPALMTVFPWMVTILGGHQSARTLHFVFVVLLLLFVVVHLSMLAVAGFGRHLHAMITGYAPSRGRRP
jgi:thiosulfate reductase cytochrome b subunit